jgi:uncharacterized membrane protein HdeD (DUF308 family)
MTTAVTALAAVRCHTHEEDEMSAHATRTGAEPSPVPPEARTAAREVTGYWWAWLAAGIAWVAISLVILQFNDASVTTVGVLIGVMFALASAQTLVIASAPDSAGVPTGTRWVSGAFSLLFAISALLCFISPADTFAGLADMLGFLFLVVGIWWMVRAFLERPVNPAWWLTLISGILMTVLAFWTSGQLFIHKAYVLLVFAGIWALMEGTVDIVRSFEIRRIHKEL